MKSNNYKKLMVKNVNFVSVKFVEKVINVMLTKGSPKNIQNSKNKNL